ncbi:MAG: hypothetical protein CMM07_10330 [Rhodopirellula sp.]|nr:hypothetical protein [Rhodopirellula sp.]
MFAIAAGFCARLLCIYVFSWRRTVIISTIVLSVAMFASVAVVLGADRSFLEVFTLSLEFLLHQSWPERLRSTIQVLSCAFVFAASHTIKACLVHAITTAIGISIWWGGSCGLLLTPGSL